MTPWDSTRRLAATLDRLEGIADRACEKHSTMLVFSPQIVWCCTCGAIQLGDGEWVLPKRVKP
jgi:hypothetical protein